MSAFGYKRTSNPYLANVRFTPVSGHSCPKFRVGGYHHLSDNFSVQKVQANSRGSLSAS